ncbi:MAG: hypothetical protein JSS31_14670 [Proteobacteria bacterium]|nr:hypothetical protein [Pseudomonadota bacterium]MBS0495157.1 hypothetical protein [Pseudomonadota bacterium]
MSDIAEACAAAMIRPVRGFKPAQYTPQAPIFAELSRVEVAGCGTVAAITAISRARDGTWLHKIACPFCGGTHMHGGSQGPVPGFGHRVADCGLGGYALLAVEAANV